MNSLIISDKEKYGEDSPAVSISQSPGENPKPEERLSAPTVDLVGTQVEGFGLDAKANLDEVGCAKIYFKVKSVKKGESYGDSLTTKKSPTKVTIQITHAEPMDKDDEEAEEEGEDPKEEAIETAEEEAAEEDSEGEDEGGETESPEGKTSTSADPEESLKTKAKKKQAAVMGHTMEKVSPKDAELPE